MRIPDAVRRLLGPGSEPLWYAGPLEADSDVYIETVPVSADVDPASLRATPIRTMLVGAPPDDELADRISED